MPTSSKLSNIIVPITFLDDNNNVGTPDYNSSKIFNPQNSKFPKYHYIQIYVKIKNNNNTGKI